MSEARKDFSDDRTFLIDLTRCTGCRGCQVACKQWNQLEAEKTTFFSGQGYQNPPAMSQYTFTMIKFRDYEKNGQNEFAFYKEMCMHCNDPACVSVCPVFALHKSPEGPVFYDDKRCIGCRFCMVACPFGVPKYEWNKAFPLVRKCTGCYSRVKEGMIPACAKTCPSAIRYGSRKEMIAEAKRRMAARPEVYFNKIYGLEEAGGTSVLYLSGRAVQRARFSRGDVSSDTGIHLAGPPLCPGNFCDGCRFPHVHLLALSPQGSDCQRGRGAKKARRGEFRG